MHTHQTTLALGGGGARGVAHLGVIEGLLESNWSIERIVGISIGSLAGAIYAYEPDIEKVKTSTLDYLLSDEFQRHQHHLFDAGGSSNQQASPWSVFTWYDRVKGFVKANRRLLRVLKHPSLLPETLLQLVIEHLLPDADVSDANIPLAVCAVDLRSGEKVLLDRGPVRTLVQASMSLPGIFPPVEYDGMLLTDVGVFNSVPLAEARASRPGHVTAVDVSSRLENVDQFNTALEVLIRMEEIGEHLFRQQVTDTPELHIRPEVHDVEWFDFSAAAELYDAGLRECRTALGSTPFESEPHPPESTLTVTSALQ